MFMPEHCGHVVLPGPGSPLAAPNLLLLLPKLDALLHWLPLRRGPLLPVCAGPPSGEAEGPALASCSFSGRAAPCWSSGSGHPLWAWGGQWTRCCLQAQEQAQQVMPQ